MAKYLCQNLKLVATHPMVHVEISKISQEMVGSYAGMADFGRLVSSISTRGGRLCPPIGFASPKNFP